MCMIYRIEGLTELYNSVPRIANLVANSAADLEEKPDCLFIDYSKIAQPFRSCDISNRRAQRARHFDIWHASSPYLLLPGGAWPKMAKNALKIASPVGGASLCARVDPGRAGLARF